MTHTTAALFCLHFFCCTLWLAPPGIARTIEHNTPAVVSSETYEARIRAAELAGNHDEVVAICREWYASGEYSPGILNWNYNALMSVDDYSFLFTHGDSDTYPALMLQYALDVRPDVAVLNIQLLENPDYRALIARRHRLDWMPPGCDLPEFIRRIAYMGKQSDGQYTPAFFGVMSDKELLQADKQNLYLTGLALKFSPTAFDNLAFLRYNYENRFRLDYLKLPLQPEKQMETVARLNLNYIPALVLLYRHYQTSGEIFKAEKVEGLARKIARAAGRSAEVNALFQKPEQDPSFRSSINPKALEKPMKKIATRLYAAETETTNAQYELFLQDLLKNKDIEQLTHCTPAKTDWRALLPEHQRALPDAVVFKHGHPDDEGMPVQNISFDAAQRYCDWITQVYNAYPGKKKFKRVRFRLPTSEEWTLAASGGLKDAPYPWGGYYVRNSKGCYLCNLNAVEPCENCIDMSGAANDGGFFPVGAATYYPNDFGLYNMSGNVAEMIAEPFKTMGGSWKDDPLFCQIRTVSTCSSPAPTTGFRVFMEITEE